MDIETRHRQEKKELQAKTQKIKHAAPKGDKKRQKEAKEEIAQLEAELQKRHEQELKEATPDQLQACETGEAATKLSEDVNGLMINSQTDNSNTRTKKSKAAKRRERNERENREREARIAEGKLASISGPRNVEQQLIAAKLSGRNLTLHDIASDGDCLYKAVAHQLSLKTNQPTITVSELRTKVANEMKENQGDYLPFITTSDGDMLDEQGFVDYCDRLQHTHEWGGHVEIKALTAVLKHAILVIQADLPDIMTGQDDSKDESLTVVYHKHLYELGEHYNSVVPFHIVNKESTVCS